jgi:hypothetical protein
MPVSNPKYQLLPIDMTYSLQPILGIERTFDLAMEIRKHLFSESLDGINTLFLA